jgi:hypothetical protein
MTGAITTVGANHKTNLGWKLKLVTTNAVIAAIVPANIIFKWLATRSLPFTPPRQDL